MLHFPRRRKSAPLPPPNDHRLEEDERRWIEEDRRNAERIADAERKIARRIDFAAALAEAFDTKERE